MARLFFPQKTIELMESQGLKESDIYDEYNNGQLITFPNNLKGVEKKYYTLGFKIGFTYKFSNTNDEYVVLKTWKRKVL